MRYMVNLYIGGEEHFIDVLPENILDGQDRAGTFKSLDITVETLEKDVRIDYISKASKWFHKNGLDMNEFFNFVEHTFGVSIESVDEDEL